MSKLLTALALAGAALRALSDEVAADDSCLAAAEALEGLTEGDIHDVQGAVQDALRMGLQGFTDDVNRRYYALEQKIGVVDPSVPATPVIVPPVSGSPEAGIKPEPNFGGIGSEGNTVDAAQGIAPGLGRDAPLGEPQGGDQTFRQPVAEVTDEATQGDSLAAAEVGEHIVPGAVSGPDNAGVVREEHGYVVDAPVGSYDAAASGVQTSNTTGVTTSTDTAAGPGTPTPAPEIDPSVAEANGSVVDPTWSEYDEDSQEWTDDQVDAFEEWADSLPDDYDPAGLPGYVANQLTAYQNAEKSEA